MAATWIGVMLGVAIYISQGGRDSPFTTRIVGIFDKNSYAQPSGSQMDTNATTDLSTLPGGNNQVTNSNQTDLHSLIKNKLSTS